MTARKVNLDEDYAQIASWAELRETRYDKRLFPPTGYIVDGVAAYFAYYTESGCVWLENLISNPTVPAELRDLSVTTIITAILREARDKGCIVAYAATSNDKVIERALQHGAIASPGQTQLVLQFKS